MNPGGLVFGLLDTTERIGLPAVAAKFRDLTISWMRYSYRDSIIEGSTISQILADAMDGGHRYCLIQPYGAIIVEQWDPDNSSHGDFVSRINRWIEENDFFVAGRIIDGGDSWFGIGDRNLLVDLNRYRELGAPLFEQVANGPVDLPRTQLHKCAEGISRLAPLEARLHIKPRISGWPFVAASLESGRSVHGLDTDLLGRTLNIADGGADGETKFSGYLGRGIERFCSESNHESLTPDQTAFLKVIARQTANARKGVFLWNIEPYTDVESPPREFRQTISSLYSVAAGFKANRILHTHGFDGDTRMVFFDYSPNALAVKRRMIDEWSGEDFPRFLRDLFREFPHPDTYYQLWGDLAPDDLDDCDLEDAWSRELERWGGAHEFQAHWNAFRALRHEFVDCNILTEPDALLKLIKRESGAVIWWSNAFFTMFSNWYYGLEERRDFYREWVERLAATNPDILVYGSDNNNASVNCIRAGDYFTRFREFGGAELIPCRQHRMEIRM